MTMTMMMRSILVIGMMFVFYNVLQSQVPEVALHKVWHLDHSSDVFFTQSQAVPRILYLATSRVKNTENYGGFYAISEKQGHLYRVKPADSSKSSAYFGSLFETPGVLHPSLDAAYPYQFPFASGREYAIHIATGIELPGGSIDVSQPYYFLSIDSKALDTIFASRSGVVVGALSNTMNESGEARVDVSHSDGGVMHYLHLHPGSLFVKYGDNVIQGQPLGLVGKDGTTELFLTTLDTVVSHHEHQWKGTEFRKLYTHFHEFKLLQDTSLILFPPGESHSFFPKHKRGHADLTEKSTLLQTERNAYFPTFSRLSTNHSLDKQAAIYLPFQRKWQDRISDSTLYKKVITSLQFGMIQDRSAKSIQKHLIKELGISKSVAQQFTESDINALSENLLPVMLWMEGFLEDDLVTVDSTNTIWDELAWYDIQDDMWVAEIGAGDGVISMFLACHYPGIRAFYNDIHLSGIYFGKKYIDKNPDIHSPLRVFPQWGKKKSTGLEAFQFDRIIIRDALHHFKKMPEMLESIRKSMTANSQLIINDPMGELDPETGCGLEMSSELIRKMLLNNGFNILEERQWTDKKEVWFRCGI